jgi:hypothetical protein
MISVILVVPFWGFEISTYLKIFLLYSFFFVGYNVFQAKKEVLASINIYFIMILIGICQLYWGNYLNVALYIIFAIIYKVYTSKKKNSDNLGLNQELSQSSSLQKFFEGLQKDMETLENHYYNDFPFFYPLNYFNSLVFILLMVDKYYLDSFQTLHLTTRDRLLLHTLLLVGVLFWFCIRTLIVLFANPVSKYKLAMVCIGCASATGVCTSAFIDLHKIAVKVGEIPIDSPFIRGYQKAKLGYIPLTKEDTVLGDVYKIVTTDPVPLKTRNGIEGCLDTETVIDSLKAKGIAVASKEEIAEMILKKHGLNRKE